MYSRIGQTKTSDGAFVVDIWPLDSFDLEEDERKRREDVYTAKAKAHKETIDGYFNGLPAYEYSPLPSTKSIRLVKFVPQSTSPVLVHCTIEDFMIDDAPPFSALSYTWGNPFSLSTPALDQHFHEPTSISCDGKRLYVGRNLYEAMRRIRPSHLDEPREETYQKTKLISCAEDGDTIGVERLLREGADVHAKDAWNCTALHYAAENGQVLIVKALVYAGSDICAVDDHGRTPLDCAKSVDSRTGPWFEIQQFLEYQLKEGVEKQRRESSLRGRVSDVDYFWIDAICINQEDVLEKSAQVSLMGEIYKKATHGIVWLGPTYEKWDDPALTLLQGVWTLEGARTGGQIDEDVLERMLALFDNEHPYDVVLGRYDPASFAVRDWINTFDGNALFDGWLLGPPLFHRTWFSRVWILQEVFMSRDISVVCGQYIVPWDILIFMSSFIEGMKSAFRYKKSTQKRIIGALLVAARSQRAPALQLEKWKQSFKRRGKLPMLNALQLTRNANSTDPRDKVFSALSFSNMAYTTRAGLQELKPDYTMSVEEVYITIGRALYESHGSCALSLAGMRADNDDLKLPSWIPDLRNPLSASPSGIDVERPDPVTANQNAAFDRATGILSTSHVRITPENELHVAGIIWDTISELAPSGLGDVGDDLEDLRTWVDFLATFDYSSEKKREILRHTLTEYSADFSVDLTDLDFRHWLVFQCCTGIFELHYYLRDWVEHFTIPDIDWCAGYTVENDMERVTSLVTEARDLFTALGIDFDLDDKCTDQQRALHNFFSPIAPININVNTKVHQIWEQTVLPAEPFGRSVQTKDPTRRLVRLQGQGGVGAAPEMAQVGDVLCLLHGARVPYVMRKSEDGKFRLVGEAFVDGLRIGNLLLEGMLEGRVQKICIV